MTKTNPKQYIQSFPEIKMLFDEVINILVFLEQRFNDEDQEFYFRTLSGNLSVEEKFLIEVYNVNFIRNLSPLINFNTYDQNQYSNFNLKDYITPKYIRLKGNYYGVESYDKTNSKDNIRIILDDENIYSLIELYFVDSDNKELKLYSTIKKLKKEIVIDEILKESIHDNLGKEFLFSIVESKQRKEFKLLLKTTLKASKTNIFYMHRLGVMCNEDLSRYNFYHVKFEQNINDWIKNYFN